MSYDYFFLVVSVPLLGFTSLFQEVNERSFSSTGIYSEAYFVNLNFLSSTRVLGVFYIYSIVLIECYYENTYAGFLLNT